MLEEERRDPVGGVDYPRTLPEFDEWFSSEAACVEYLERIRWSDGFRFAIGDHITAWGDQPGEELGAESAPVEDRRDPTPRRHEAFHVVEDRFQHLRGLGVHFAGHHQQRLALRVVHPGVGRGGRDHLTLGLFGLGKPGFPESVASLQGIAANSGFDKPALSISRNT